MNEKQNYADEMFAKISQVIEETGQKDPDYDDTKKANDIFNVLESLLAYTVYTTCVTKEHVEESTQMCYDNIKAQALEILEKNPPE